MAIIYDEGDFSLYDAIKRKDETAFKKVIIKLLKAVINDEIMKNEAAYIPDQTVTIPLELEWDENYNPKDAWINKAIEVISNFEGDSVEEAKNKSKKLLEQVSG
jgi:hypothetical protein